MARSSPSNCYQGVRFTEGDSLNGEWSFCRAFRRVRLTRIAFVGTVIAGVVAGAVTGVVSAGIIRAGMCSMCPSMQCVPGEVEACGPTWTGWLLFGGDDLS